ncbi:MAG: hypothetical protein HQK51_00885 [Oligoflexia bacterium]|nr:hypothetical protein [Oligoflexia bacterium]
MTGLNHNLLNKTTFEQIMFIDTQLNIDKLPNAEKLKYSIYRLKFFEKDVHKYFEEYINCWKYLLHILKNTTGDKLKLINILKNYFVEKFTKNFNVENLNYYSDITKLLKKECTQDFNLELINTLFAKKISTTNLQLSGCSIQLFAYIIITLSINHNQESDFPSRLLLKKIIPYYFHPLSVNQKINILSEIIEIIFQGKCKNIHLIKSLYQLKQTQLYEIFKYIGNLTSNTNLNLNNKVEQSEQTTIHFFFKLFTDPNNIIFNNNTHLQNTISFINNLFIKSVSKECENILVDISTSLIIKNKNLPLVSFSTILKIISKNLFLGIIKKNDLTLIIKNIFKNDNLTSNSKHEIISEIIHQLILFDKNLSDKIKYSKWLTESTNCQIKRKEKNKIKEEQLSLF